MSSSVLLSLQTARGHIAIYNQKILTNLDLKVLYLHFILKSDHATSAKQRLFKLNWNLMFEVHMVMSHTIKVILPNFAFLYLNTFD